MVGILNHFEMFQPFRNVSKFETFRNVSKFETFRNVSNLKHFEMFQILKHFEMFQILKHFEMVETFRNGSKFQPFRNGSNFEIVAQFLGLCGGSARATPAAKKATKRSTGRHAGTGLWDRDTTLRCVCCSWRQLFQLCSYSSAASSCSCASWAWVSGWACAMPTGGRVPGPAGQDHAQLAWAMSSGASHAQLGQPCPTGPAAAVASCS